MKLNSKTIIHGQNVVLVPYEKQHVPRYHEWMKSEELQKLTASEPLSLDQEYNMQESWREDDDKCTFIILDKKKYDETKDEISSMVGDTNIFITDKETHTGEIEIMIAEESARGKKFGWEAVILMLLYGNHSINIQLFEAKISLTNTISSKMFQKLGFVVKSQSNVFQEITLEKKLDSEWIKWLEEQFNYNVEST